MTASARRERIRLILRQTLDQQFDDSRGYLDAKHSKWQPSGPWRTLFEEYSTWDSATQFNQELYLALRGQFRDDLIREILLAAAGLKVSRLSLKERKIASLRVHIEQHGLQIVTSENQWIPLLDFGKGGWANRGVRGAESGDPNAIRNVYIASDTALAETAKLLDEAGEDNLFGALLGIPACCREAFDRFKPLAAAKQYDFVPHVLGNTGGAPPFDWRLNYTAQYFGCSLLSFFPCSFRCPSAAAVSDRALRLVADCDPAWLNRVVKLQQANVLYTENSGLHLFRARLDNGRITYGPQDLQSTEPNELADLLRRGDWLDVGDVHAVQVYRGTTKIADLSGKDAHMCVFH
ncbi:MAG: hypothetical protein JOZ08_12560 [Verrucomicrobia bacterium]|nr:hypothetical protein [Verrucomicrobiota bacterium]MBV8278598.1 hypothetical protein [Verrucomicrobiota bacterium]